MYRNSYIILGLPVGQEGKLLWYEYMYGKELYR